MVDQPPPATHGPSAWQFGIGSMLLFVAASAAVFGLARATGVGFETAWFAVGIFALAALAANLIHAAQGRYAVVYETDSSTDAFLCAQFLHEKGVSAEIREGEIAGLAGVRHRPSRVVVPAAEADRAAELLAEQHGAAGPEDDETENV